LTGVFLDQNKLGLMNLQSLFDPCVALVVFCGFCNGFGSYDQNIFIVGKALKRRVV
jgi:hypothetical protein